MPVAPRMRRCPMEAARDEPKQEHTETSEVTRRGLCLSTFWAWALHASAASATSVPRVAERWQPSFDALIDLARKRAAEPYRWPGGQGADPLGTIPPIGITLVGGTHPLLPAALWSRSHDRGATVSLLLDGPSATVACEVKPRSGEDAGRPPVSGLAARLAIVRRRPTAALGVGLLEARDPEARSGVYAFSHPEHLIWRPVGRAAEPGWPGPARIAVTGYGMAPFGQAPATWVELGQGSHTGTAVLRPCANDGPTAYWPLGPSRAGDAVFASLFVETNQGGTGTPAWATAPRIDWSPAPLGKSPSPSLSQNLDLTLPSGPRPIVVVDLPDGSSGTHLLERRAAGAWRVRICIPVDQPLDRPVTVRLPSTPPGQVRNIEVHRPVAEGNAGV